jgi:hypothetical protein
VREKHTDAALKGRERDDAKASSKRNIWIMCAASPDEVTAVALFSEENVRGLI